MKKFKLIPLLLCLLITPGCTLFKPFNSLLLTLLPSGHLKTSDASFLDGAWMNVKCTCAGKDANPNLQFAHVLQINGNFMFQSLNARSRDPKRKNYCLSHEEAVLNQIADRDFEIVSLSHRTFSPDDRPCGGGAPEPKRVWKNLTVIDSELKFESTGGCNSGPMSCVFKRLDQ